MEDGDKRKNMESDSTRQSLSNLSNAGVIFQSIRIRCGSVFSDITDREFMESQLRFVLYCGIFFWVVLISSKII